MEEKVKCPKCGSDQLTAEKHGFSLGKAAGGAILTGGVGLLAGFHGSGKIDITCLKCGHVFKPGNKPAQTKAIGPTMPLWLSATIIIGTILVIIYLIVR